MGETNNMRKAQYNTQTKLNKIIIVRLNMMLTTTGTTQKRYQDKVQLNKKAQTTVTKRKKEIKQLKFIKNGGTKGVPTNMTN